MASSMFGASSNQQVSGNNSNSISSQQQQQYPSSSMSGYDLKLQSVMIYNPKLIPLNKKPSETDIQDAKLIYYYPADSAIEEKRNHVGLAEGSYQFWSTFLRNADTGGKRANTSSHRTQVSIFDKYIHAQEEVEDDIWLYIVWAKSESSDQEIRSLSQDEEYYSSQTGVFADSRVTQEHAKMLLRHFYGTFTTFFGRIASHVENQQKPQESTNITKEEGVVVQDNQEPKEAVQSEENGNQGDGKPENEQNKDIQINNSESTEVQSSASPGETTEASQQQQQQSPKIPISKLFNQYIVRYLDLNGSSNINKHLNVLRYGMCGFQYAPIEKSLFMTLQSLLNMLVTIDPTLQHSAIFYNGYFIYSTLDHDQAFTFYEYFYAHHKPFSYSDKKLANHFAFYQKIGNEEARSYGNVFNSMVLGKNDSQSQAGGAVTSANSAVWADKKEQGVVLQRVFLGSELTEKQMSVYYDKQLLILTFYERDAIVKQENLMEINAAINRNCEKLTVRLEKAIQESTKKEEIYRYMYFNQMNIATKISNPLQLQTLLVSEIDQISQIYSQLSADTQTPFSAQSMNKTTNTWIYGYKNIGRILIMLFPGTLSLPKVAEEADKLFKNYFSLLYL